MNKFQETNTNYLNFNNQIASMNGHLSIEPEFVILNLF